MVVVAVGVAVGVAVAMRNTLYSRAESIVGEMMVVGGVRGGGGTTTNRPAGGAGGIPPTAVGVTAGEITAEVATIKDTTR